jgi:plastocyanin
MNTPLGHPSMMTVTGKDLLMGLDNLKVSDLNFNLVNGGNFINVSTLFNTPQSLSFLQSFLADPKATQTAANVTLLAQQRNLLPINDHIVGFANGNFYVAVGPLPLSLAAVTGAMPYGSSYISPYTPSDYGSSGTAPKSNMVDIGIYDDAFQPASVTVTAGATIRWTNLGEHVHTAKETTARWNSGDLPPGASYTVRLTTPGTYSYSCDHHAKEHMEGTIIVTAK